MEKLLLCAIIFLGISLLACIIGFIVYMGGNLYIKYSDKTKKIEIKANSSDFNPHN